MAHLEDRELNALLDGILTGERLWRCQKHLESCDRCRDAFAALKDQDEAIATQFSHDPGEAYFASFADRVVSRIALSEAAGETADSALLAADTTPVDRKWWQRPRNIALAGTLATVVAGAGLVLLMAREAPRPLSERAARLNEAHQEAAPSTPEPREIVGTEASKNGSDAKEKDQARAHEPSRLDDLRRDQAPEPLATPPAAAPISGTRMSEVPREGAGERRAAQAPTPTSGFAAPPKALPQSQSTNDRIREMKRAALGPAGQKPADGAAPSSELQASGGATASGPAPQRALAAPQPKQETAPSALLGKTGSRDEEESKATAWTTRCGTVHDDQGRPLAGVAVTAVTAARSSTTGRDGRFCIELPPGDHVLQVLAVGFRPVRLDVPAGGLGGELAAVLTPIQVLGTGGVASRERAAAPSSGTFAAPPAASLKADAANAALATLSGGEAALRAMPPRLRAQAIEATKLQMSAESSAGAAGYEKAAAAWEKLVPTAGGGTSEVEIRARIAECRYLAWRRLSDPQRASTAVQALTAFIGRVPIGDRQILATRWLDHIRGR